MRKYILLFTALFIISPIVLAEIFKWVDDDGNVHFSDNPPERAKTKKITLKINTYQSVQVIRPIPTRAPSNKAEPADKSVIMYSAEWCGVCRRAKRFFNQNKIAFKEYDIDKSEEAKRKYKLLNARGVPVIFIDDIRLNGFSARQFKTIYYQ